ncbi:MULTISPECIES: LysR family transcriptional regulator [Sinorhizobium]|uniref:LysR family transcriptional regulator n=1 Tax=Sinorhizobium TaxID=28105 RepID=UPI000BEA5A1E|nr:MULTISPECIES: LysR family transcriptional regulator [Sinorhizobium]PDT50891.1 LysR family transcriptional regulator [Sinorhizobium sp. NG07B]POH25013.1 LysR family transcriptional regulator [Sinorhizobium americanum]
MSINRISLYHLETLIWIARLGTFAAAAEKLNTTQPGISARISELEERLGAKLFQRNGRSANLTPSGRQLVREYLPLWEQLQGMLLRSAGFDQIRGIIRVGAGEIAAATCLPIFVTEMKERWPALTFEIEIELTAQMIQALLSGKIDLAFAAGLVAHPALTATPIGAAELLWVASPSFAKRMEEGGPDATFSLWSLPSHSPIYQLMKDGLEGIPVRRHSINLCNNVRTMIDIVTMGGGFALIPKSLVRSQLESGSLVSVMVDRQIEPIMFHVVARAAEGDPVVKEILRCASGISLDDRLQPYLLGS